MYVLLWNAYLPSDGPRDLLLCYQRTNSGIKPVYSAKLDPRGKFVKVAHVECLEDHLHAIGTGTIGKLSAYARRDLAAQRFYVEYKYVSIIDSLKVIWLAEGENPGSMSAAEEYFLLADPLTKEKLKPGEFYKKYGLPLSSKELDMQFG